MMVRWANRFTSELTTEHLYKLLGSLWNWPETSGADLLWANKLELVHCSSITRLMILKCVLAEYWPVLKPAFE